MLEPLSSWPVGASKPKTSQLSKGVTTGAGALGGAFWGFLFGLLFFVPIFGPAVGAAIGALMGHFANYGIDQSFIDQVRQDHPGHLSLVPVVEWAVTDRVAEAGGQGAAVRDHPDQPVQRFLQEPLSNFLPSNFQVMHAEM